MITGIIRLFAKLIGIHIHDWGNWKNYNGTLYQMRHCKTCNKNEVQ